MIMRFAVPATAAAVLGLQAASALAAQTAPSAAMKTCAQLETQAATLLPQAIPSMVTKATNERAEGARLCNAGKTEQGIATLEQAVNDALYRG